MRCRDRACSRTSSTSAPRSGSAASGDARLAETKNAHSSPRQPDDVKAVYDAVFDKVVTKPMQGFHDTTSIALDIIDAALKLADYMVAHGDKVKIVDTRPQAADRETQDEVNALNANAPRMNEAQRRLRILLQGGQVYGSVLTQSIYVTASFHISRDRFPFSIAAISRWRAGA